MKKFLKKHMGLIITLIVILAFPASLSTQARLNMRNIITGIAIDKDGDQYEVTAQVVKASPNSSSAGTGANLNFVSDKGDSIISALSKLSYKTGKVAAFSHTNFLLVGEDVLQDDLSQTLDYFIRENVIKDSALMLVSKGKAKDEIKKTKDVELSVGLGLQKVFLYKEKEGDGKMVSLLSFMKHSKSKSKSIAISTLSLNSGEQKSGEQQQNSEQSSQSSNSEEGYFDSKTPLACFVNAKYVGDLESEDEVDGYMLAESEVESISLLVGDLNFGQFQDAKLGLKIKRKNNKIRVRYEDLTPCVDVYVNIKNSEIREIKNSELVTEFSPEEFKKIKTEISNEISKKISIMFEKSKSMNVDIFGAYDLANKFFYKKTKLNYDSYESFLQHLKLNVIVKVSRLEY